MIIGKKYFTRARNRPYQAILSLLGGFILLSAGKVHAATFTITSGGETNATFASGTIQDVFNGNLITVAEFTLTQNSKTGYGNHSYAAGALGLGVDHASSTNPRGNDSFSYSLTITPIPIPNVLSTRVNIIVFEPNFAVGRNYGPTNGAPNIQTDTITANWTGDAQGVIFDPNNNLAGVATGDLVSSGFTTQWNIGDRSTLDWSFAQTNWNLTVQTESLNYSFSTPGETAAEGIAFDADFEFTEIPEPTSIIALIGVTCLGAVVTRRQDDEEEDK